MREYQVRFRERLGLKYPCLLDSRGYFAEFARERYTLFRIVLCILNSPDKGGICQRWVKPIGEFRQFLQAM